MNKKLAGIAFLVLALSACAAAIVWIRPAHRSALAHQPETIKNTLERIKLPPGFKIGLYALVPGARHMAVGPQGKVIFVGTAETKVYGVTVDAASGLAGGSRNSRHDRDDGAKRSLFRHGGILYVAEKNRILSFPNAEGLMNSLPSLPWP